MVPILGVTLPKFNVAIFASGEGSNAQNLWNFAQDSGHPVKGVVCDRSNAIVIEKAKQDNVKVVLIDRKSLDQEKQILEVCRDWDINWIFLAGYMSILSPAFLQHFYNSKTGHFQVINIHPSLLPAYPGMHSYQKAFDDQNSIHGITVHYVDEGVDSGPIIAQDSFAIEKNWSFDEFVSNGKRVEHQLYKKVFLDFLKKQTVE